MRITKIEYGETASFGNFQNVSVKAEAQVDSKDDILTVYETLKASVRKAIEERIEEEKHIEQDIGDGDSECLSPLDEDWETDES